MERLAALCRPSNTTADIIAAKFLLLRHNSASASGNASPSVTSVSSASNGISTSVGSIVRTRYLLAEYVCEQLRRHEDGRRRDTVTALTLAPSDIASIRSRRTSLKVLS